ncbi:MAG: NADH-quinone oxidoreductase subunit L [Bacteroidia bacterium]|nr:NADH-quinone oxidoreductase subunit L [Bacteroidia bacterium]
MTQLVGLIPLFPLIGFLVIGLWQKKFPGIFSGILASVLVALSFIISAGIFFTLPTSPVTVDIFDWIVCGSFSAKMSFYIDPVSSVMLLIVTGVGLLIHIYSIGYMKNDEGFARFFSYMNLFVFFMLLLVLGSNYLVMYAGWEGVGLCSYLLIGFWFKNTEYNHAANKAFIVNRIGDLGFVLGIILMFLNFGSISFDQVFSSASHMPHNQPVMVTITLLLFVGAIAKSAQIPLYTWLPDAMAGPTPVSALIHAATMVTAGVYMIVRSNIIYSLAPFTLHIIAIIGLATALFSATIALAQTDIKKVLAYSTVSQLGYMFVALGVGAYSSALFHVTTHAFFKALLFLAAGSVIHAMSGEQDIRNMGGLRKKLPITFLVFGAGTLAISGVPPFSGFFSKDEILAKTYLQSPFMFIVLSITSVLTAIYMFRLFFLTFYGTFRGNREQEHHLHESPPVITIPLVILAILSTLGGFLGMPSILSSHHFFDTFLSPSIAPGTLAGSGEVSHTFEWTVVAVSVLVLAAVIIWLYSRYQTRGNVPPQEEASFTPAYRVLNHKYYIDEIYDTIIVKPLYGLGVVFWTLVDNRLVDGVVTGINKGVLYSSQMLRRVQTGNIGFYIFVMVFGIIALLIFNLVL